MALERHIAVVAEEAEIVAALDVGSMWDRMLGEFLERWTDLERQGLPIAEVERQMDTFMNGLSSKPVEDLARKSASVAYNQGRNAEILSAFDQVKSEFVIRSELLDDATCKTCEGLDGREFKIGSSDYHAHLPPALCEGGARCRGFYIAVGIA